jgi:hypothetical protein
MKARGTYVKDSHLRALSFVLSSYQYFSAAISIALDMARFSSGFISKMTAAEVG